MLPDWNKARWKAKVRPILQAKRWNHHSSVSSHLQKVRNQRPTEPSIWKQELAAWGEPYAKWGIIANRLPGKEEPWNEDESRLVMHYLNPGLGILKHKHTWGMRGRHGYTPTPPPLEPKWKTTRAMVPCMYCLGKYHACEWKDNCARS